MIPPEDLNSVPNQINETNLELSCAKFSADNLAHILSAQEFSFNAADSDAFSKSITNNIDLRNDFIEGNNFIPEIINETSEWTDNIVEKNVTPELINKTSRITDNIFNLNEDSGFIDDFLDQNQGILRESSIIDNSENFDTNDNYHVKNLQVQNTSNSNKENFDQNEVIESESPFKKFLLWPEKPKTNKKKKAKKDDVPMPTVLSSDDWI